MYNEELFKRLGDRYSHYELKLFAEMMAARHELLYIEHLQEGLEDFTEEDFERDWWMNKFQELSEVKEDRIINQVVDKFRTRSAVGIKKYGTTLDENNTDDFLKHLQEELMDGVNYIEKIRDTLNKKGYSKLEDVRNRNDFDD